MKGKIGIVAGYSSGRLLAPAFAKRGVDCVHIQPCLVPTRLLRTYQQNDYCAEQVETEDIPFLLAALRAQNVVDVLPGSEIGVPLAWKLRQKLYPINIPCVEALYDKWSQTEMLRAAGLRATLQGQFSDIETAIKWARQHQLYELVAKPSASTGSDSVFLCKEPFEESLAHAFAKILGQTNELLRKNAFVLVQERLLGEEYVVDLVIDGPKIRVAALFQYVKKSVNGAPFVYSSMNSISSEDPVARQVAEFAVKAARALVGTQFNTTTAVHMELIGECLVEAGFRTHGGQGAILGGEVSGLSQIEMWVDAITNPTRFAQHPFLPKQRVMAREVFLISKKAGRLTKFAYLDSIQKLPSFRSFSPKIRIGEKIQVTRDLLTSPGSVILIGDHVSQLDQDEATIRELENQGLYELE